MRKLTLTLFLMFIGTQMANASDGYDNIFRAAHELENASSHFYTQLRYDDGYSHVGKDAMRFAKAARHFHRQVEQGSNYGHIRDDYAELAAAYAHARQEFGGSHDAHHNRHFRGDFRGVERAFYNLNRAIEYEHQQSRYSRRGYDQHDGRYDQNSRRYDRDDEYGRHHNRYDSGLTITFRGRVGR